jgi:hypothetical protein
VRRRVPDVPSLAAHPLLPCSPARSCRPAAQPSEARRCPVALSLSLSLSHSHCLSLSRPPHSPRHQTEARPRYRSRSTRPTSTRPLCLPACLHTHLNNPLSASPPSLSSSPYPRQAPSTGCNSFPQHRLASASQPRLANLTGFVRSTQPAHTCPCIVFLFPISHYFPCCCLLLPALPFMVMVTAMVWSSLVSSLTSPTRPVLYPLRESPYTRVILLLAALVETSPACFAPAHANAAFPWSYPWALSWARHVLPCPCLAFPIWSASLHALHMLTRLAHAYASWHTRFINPTLSYTVLHTCSSINPLSFHTHASSPIAYRPSLPISKST